MRLAAAAALGALHALAFAPLPLWWWQILCMAGAAWLAFGAPSPRIAAATGLLFGLANFALGLAWLHTSMHDIGGLPAPLSILAVLLLSAYLALFGALAFGLTVRFWSDHAPLRAALLFSGLFALGEIARGLIFTGFPWLSIGYAHVDGPLAGLAPLSGVHGVGLAAAFVAGAIAASMRLASPTMRQRLPALGLAIALIVGASLASRIEWAMPVAAPISVRLMQGNVQQSMKFERERARRAILDYAAKVVASDARLNVLPETAWTVPLDAADPRVLAAMVEHLARTGGVVAIGAPMRVAGAAHDRPASLTNSVVVVDGTGAIVAKYDKRHLVPFGEFVPWGFRWFVDLMTIPLGEFARGAARQPSLVLDGVRVGFNICYEDLFGEELAEQVRLDDANVLVNMTNIAWFGDSLALPQHLHISRMRTLELARPMLRATNTGVTAVIDHRGSVTTSLPTWQAGVLDSQVQGTAGMTPFARTGLWAALIPALLCVGAGAAFAAKSWRRATLG